MLGQKNGRTFDSLRAGCGAPCYFFGELAVSFMLSLCAVTDAESP